MTYGLNTVISNPFSLEICADFGFLLPSDEVSSQKKRLVAAARCKS
jgi:hypothetical protein